MINEQLLRQGLQRLLKDTDASIRERLADEPDLGAALRERHAGAVRAERTEGSAKGFNAFADEAITQAAVHWVLGSVFVRFLEDNGWLDERNSKVVWISGPGERLAIAKSRRTAFLRPDPDLTDRDYLLHAFAEVAKLPGVAGLFDLKHNPLYSLQPTGPGAGKIVEFFQKVDPDSNELIHDFGDSDHGTRFLGDLYQNLSEAARKRYALCQTPSFVIDFILDRTLTPAQDAFGLDTVRMIDPSCGSGHFLLAAFSRLARAWEEREPATNPPARVQRALDAVFGVDLNPFAVEISRFRLLIAALGSSRIDRLKDAPNFHFNLATGDSLLHGSRIGGGGIAQSLFEDRLQHFYETEDADDIKRILGQTYHVVVGNPPYINVSDAVLREAYRNRFVTCHGKYQLGVPFTERFFDLTVRSDDPKKETAGWMGMIVANAFMRLSFGTILVRDYLARRDLTHVVDTSGLNLPGHGTPTVILLARHQEPIDAKPVRAVRGIVGVSAQGEDLESSLVWREIVDYIDQPGFSGTHVSVADAPRSSFARHPWAIGGGGAAELKIAIEGGADSVLDSVGDPGVQTLTLADDVFVRPVSAFRRIRMTATRPFVTGDDVRDWVAHSKADILVPANDPPQQLWPFRSTLSNRMSFGQTQIERGLTWWEYGMTVQSRMEPPVITLACIVTHNHFSLCTDRRAFNRHALVIRLIKAAKEEPFELLGPLNSSVGCFWLKQVCHDKGGGGVGGGLAAEPWERFMCIDGTKLKQFPLPSEKPREIAQLIQTEANARNAILPERLCALGVPTRAALDSAREQAGIHLARMISLQEELDWQCYRLYGLTADNLNLQPAEIPSLRLGERAFEIVLAREGGKTAWFERHHSIPITELPAHWPQPYRDLIERRLALIETNRDIALIERPEYKRRWNLPRWEELESSALKAWLLDRLESNEIWKELRPVSCAQLRDTLARDLDWLLAAEIYNGGPLDDLDQFVITLATPEAVPFLPVLRYTEAGLRKRTEWEEVWRLQRQEDAGEKVEISTTPRYVSKDFQSSDYWRLRGGLDVPKERFILYPGFMRDSDETPVLGWAGWSCLDQARALAAYYQRMRNDEGWEPERLKPVLAGILDLRDWLRQWHENLDPETGLKLGTYFSEFAEAQCQDLGFSPESVLAWKPPASTPTGRRKKSKAK